MAKVYYSSVLDQPADSVWAVVRDFNNYPLYIKGVTESHIEDDKPGDAVGAVRCFVYGEMRLRQRLLAHSDAERFFTYGSCEPFAYPAPDDDGAANRAAPIDYEGTLRITPVVDGDKAFVEWSVTFDGGQHERERWTAFLADGLGQWIDSLRDFLATRGQHAPERGPQ